MRRRNTAQAEALPVSQHAICFAAAQEAMLTDDVTQVIQRARMIEVAPARLWNPSLVSELADALDRMSVKVSKLQEAQGADR